MHAKSMNTMPDPTSEADARIVIDGLLWAAGWDPADKTQVAEMNESVFPPDSRKQA